MSLTVEVRRGLNLRPEERAGLDTLIEGRPEVGVFLSVAWLSAFFVEPPANFEPALVLLRDETGLRGLVPIAVCQSLTRIRVGLLGGGMGSDRTDLLAARGFEPACSDAFLSWLPQAFGTRGTVLELRDVPSDSALWGALHRTHTPGTGRLTLQPREIHTLPYLDLAERQSSAMPTASLAQPARSLAKHRRWLEHRCSLRIELLKDSEAVLGGLASLARFLSARWRGQGRGSVLDNPRIFRFHQHVLPLLLAEGRLRMIRLSADTRTIAVFYGLASRGWWGYYLAGYDREWAQRIHLGQVALAAAMEIALAEGATEFDFLKGTERVKYLWPVRERATLDADVYSETPGAQLSRASWASREMGVGLTKAVRALLPHQRWMTSGRS